MKRKRIRYRHCVPGLLLGLLAVIFPSFVAAQAPPKAPAPAPRSLILPDKLIVNAPATLAVLDAAGRLMPKVAVELSSGQHLTTDASGRALFIAPSQSGILTARIAERNLTASSTVVDAGALPSTENPLPPAQVSSYPHFVAIHDRFAVSGSGFRGQADANHVFLGDEPCVVLASSPVALVVLPGSHSPIGTVDLRVSVSGHDSGTPAAHNPVTLVLLEVSGPSEALRVGSQTTLTIRARGTLEPVGVEVRNGSPKIVQLALGNVQHLTTSGGQSNVAPVVMNCLAAGDYAVTARLVPVVPGAETRKKD